MSKEHINVYDDWKILIIHDINKNILKEEIYTYLVVFLYYCICFWKGVIEGKIFEKSVNA